MRPRSIARVPFVALVLCASLAAMPVLAVEQAGTPRPLVKAVQATAESGVVVRVKDVVVTDDVTLVTISASYSGESIFVNLADSDSGTFLQDEDGQKYPLRKPADNTWLRVQAGDTMQGRLVFLGVVAPDSKTFKLVFNEGKPGSDRDAPGLSIDVPLS